MRWLTLLYVWALVTLAARADDTEAEDGEDECPWWHSATVYQIYPRSFKDGDGDGNGDLKGILEKADYFKEIGVDAIWLSPVYKSPMVDFGYDISNFTDIDPLFGDMATFDALMKKLKELGIKLLMDFVPNHSSTEHPWFKISADPKHREYKKYKDYYVWRNPKKVVKGVPVVPNNWKSVFAGNAWEYNSKRKQFYLHEFLTSQADFNFWNPKVAKEMSDVLQFWMNKGVDGFRADAIQWLVENKKYPDDPVFPNKDLNTYPSLNHTYDWDLPESAQLANKWAQLIYDQDLKDSKKRVLMLEVHGEAADLVKYYGHDKTDMMLPFNFLIRRLDQSAWPATYKAKIDSWMNVLPSGSAANWVLSNHDENRAATSYGVEMVDSMTILSGVLPGMKIVFNGEEIGMQDTYIRSEQIIDTSSFRRGAHWTPMQWDDSVSAGFSTNSTTWMPVNPNYWWLNVDAQRKAENSHLKIFQAIVKLKKTPVLKKGDIHTIVPDKDTLVVVRYYQDTYAILIINMGSYVHNYTSESFFMPNKLDMDYKVALASANSKYKNGTILYKKTINITLIPKAAVLLMSTDTSGTPAPSSSTGDTKTEESGSTDKKTEDPKESQSTDDPETKKKKSVDQQTEEAQKSTPTETETKKSKDQQTEEAEKASDENKESSGTPPARPFIL